MKPYKILAGALLLSMFSFIPNPSNKQVLKMGLLDGRQQKHVGFLLLAHYNNADAGKKPYSLQEIAGNEIKKQEDKLGIKHFGMPKTEFQDIQHSGLLGLYDPETDTIYLPDIYEEPGTGRIKKSAYLEQIKETMDHELGHYYADKLSENIGNGNWPKFDMSMSVKEIIGTRTVSEGTAEYFERKTNDKTGAEYDDGFFFYLNFFPNSYHIYNGGHHLVKPILDRGVRKGVEYIVVHPPKAEDMNDLPGYRARLLREIEKNG